jgi:hypothetical protein
MMDMDGSPYDSFSPLHCDDCGRESGQYFRDQEDTTRATHHLHRLRLGAAISVEE